jgi:hypothetical protein
MTILFVTALAAGCAWVQQSAPLPKTFLEGAPHESTLPRVPFTHAWASNARVTQKIEAIYIQPIRTDKLDPECWTLSSGFSITSQEDFNNEVTQLAQFFHQGLSKELERVYKENPRLRIASVPGPNALNLEIAFTEVVFSRPVTNVAAAAAPVPGVGFAVSALTAPSVAFAARFTSPDGAVLLGTLADRRSPTLRPIDLNKYTVASANRDIVSQWARELAEAIEFDLLKPVERSSRFSLLPW